MAKTSCEAEFSVIDTTAKPDGAVSVNAEQPLSDAQDLELDEITPPKIQTLEQDYWLLGGGFSAYDQNDTTAHYGWWSQNICGADGAFQTAPTLTVAFSSNHTTMGITLKFGGDAWASRVNIKWYNRANTLIAQADFTPDGLMYFCQKQVTDFRKLVITFSKMNKPYRYLKMTSIIYGQVLLFTGDDLTAASVTEEVNPISAEVAINTGSFTVHSADDAFSIVNPSGIYKSLQQRQPIVVRETVDGVVKEMGTYYLNEWENTSDNIVTMKAVDAVGVLDSLPFVGAQWTNATVPTIVAAIFSGCDVQYQVSSSYASTTLSGKIEPCTKREAMQQVAFAIGAIVDTKRTATVHIQPPAYTSASAISRDRKWAEQKLTLRPLVTGVEVTAHTFDPSGNDTTSVVGYYASELPANTAPNVLQITDATMVSPAIASSVAQRVYNYYQNRYKNEATIKTGTEMAGQAATIDSYYNKTITGIVEFMSIDLAGGFISNIELIGGVDA